MLHADIHSLHTDTNIRLSVHFNLSIFVRTLVEIIIAPRPQFFNKKIIVFVNKNRPSVLVNLPNGKVTETYMVVIIDFYHYVQM